MKIRKVDDKPMVIHTKEKAKIHAHEPKGAKIKGSNIYTVERGPKTIGAKVSDDKKKSYRKSTIHQSESKNKRLSRFERNYRESKFYIDNYGKNVMEFAQAYQQQDSSTMNSALKGIVAGVMMAGISTVLTFLGF